MLFEEQNSKPKALGYRRKHLEYYQRHPKVRVSSKVNLAELKAKAEQKAKHVFRNATSKEEKRTGTLRVVLCREADQD